MKLKATARDIMATDFHTLAPDMTIADAVGMFRRAGQREKRKIFGMMVTDENGKLAGLLSMYDILLFIRPKHIHVWGAMEDIDTGGLMQTVCERAKNVRVGDLMTPEVVTVTPDTHLLVILDIMIKKHIRRLPVIEDDKTIGIVYISDLFYHFLDRLDG